MSFRDFAKLWMERHCLLHKCPGQQVDDAATIRRELDPAFGDRPIRSLRAVDLIDLQARLSARLSPKSVNLVTGLGRKMLQSAYEWELLQGNPWGRVKPLKIPEQPFAYWTVDERDRFLRFCRREDPELARVVEFACHTGLRSGEVIGLHRDCIDFDRGVVVVRRAWNSKVGRLLEYTKGKRIREVPMNEAVLGALLPARLLAPTQAVFDLEAANASRRIRRMAKKAGVKAIRFHDLRHTFASHLRMKGVALDKLMALLGHTDLKQTMRYAHLDPKSTQGLTDVLVSAPFGHRQETESVEA